MSPLCLPGLSRQKVFWQLELCLWFRVSRSLHKVQWEGENSGGKSIFFFFFNNNCPVSVGFPATQTQPILSHQLCHEQGHAVLSLHHSQLELLQLRELFYVQEEACWLWLVQTPELWNKMKGISWLSFLGYPKSAEVALHSSDVNVPLCLGNLFSPVWDPFYLIIDIEDLIVQAGRVCVGFHCCC